jgi:hypothetical protein
MKTVAEDFLLLKVQQFGGFVRVGKRKSLPAMAGCSHGRWLERVA